MLAIVAPAAPGTNTHTYTVKSLSTALQQLGTSKSDSQDAGTFHLPFLMTNASYALFIIQLQYYTQIFLLLSVTFHTLGAP